MAKKTEIKQKTTLLSRLDDHFDAKDKVYFWILFGVCFLFCILLYDPRVSVAGDDSGYILRAYDFGRHFLLPGYQGPLYPIMLSPITLLFGLSLLPLKLFSMASMLGFFYLSYISFRKRIPGSLLFVLLLTTAINSHILYYASQTFSEAFYLLVQAFALLVFFRYFTDLKADGTKTNSIVKQHACLALALLALALTRSVGFCGIMAVVAYFLFYKEWKNAGLALGSFLIVLLAWQGIKWAVWGDGSLQFSGQSAGLMSKDPYHPAAGNETFVGLLHRFWDNSRLYLSEHFPALLDLKTANPYAHNPGELKSHNSLIALIVYAIAIGGLFFTYKKNRPLFLVGLMTGAFLLTTFISLQTMWYQDRLIITALPYIILLCFAFLYYLLSQKNLKSLQFVFILSIIILFISEMRDSLKAVEQNQKIKDMYSGLTPDWKHYIEASVWVGEHLGKDDIAAAKKPELSRIYANGKPFHGIYSIPAENTKTYLAQLATGQDKYCIVEFSEIKDQATMNKLCLYKEANLFINRGESVYFILDNSHGQPAAIAEEQGIRLTSYADLQKTIETRDPNPIIYKIKTLIDQLRESNVKYIITASLRVNPEYKTGETINTVERYMSMIVEKYPKAFSRIHQSGIDSDEPASVYVINWNQIRD